MEVPPAADLKGRVVLLAMDAQMKLLLVLRIRRRVSLQLNAPATDIEHHNGRFARGGLDRSHERYRCS